MSTIARARLSTVEALLTAGILLSGCTLPGAAGRAEGLVAGKGDPVVGNLSSSTATVAGSCSAAGICASSTPMADAAGVNMLQVADLAPMLGSKEFLLVNVHTPYAGEISGTDAHVPYNEIERNLAGLPADKDAKIVVYCRSGAMSAIAARKLVELGYTNVWDLQGGMVAWEKAGYALISKDR